MPARINRKHDQKTRDKIRTSQLINRLFSFANGEVQLTATQVRAIEVLLKKTLPDLSAITIEGNDEDGAIVHKVVLEGVKADGG